MKELSCCIFGHVGNDDLPPAWIDLGSLNEVVRVGPSGFDLDPEAEACVEDADAIVVAWEPATAPRFGYICYRLRRPGRPLVALTDGTAEAHVLALVSGADTAVGAPLNPPVIEAEVIAQRRLHSLSTADRSEAARSDDEVRCGPLIVSVGAHRVTVDGRRLSLPPRHVRLLALLASSPGRPVSRDRLLREVWSLSFDPETNVVDVTVHRLRSILKAAGTDGLIRTVRGVGYAIGYDSEDCATAAPTARDG